MEEVSMDQEYSAWKKSQWIKSTVHGKSLNGSRVQCMEKMPMRILYMYIQRIIHIYMLIFKRGIHIRMF